MSSSLAAGYLQPSQEPTSDTTLEDAMQAALAALTALPGSLVRPMWLTEPLPTPSAATNWLAFGVTEQRVQDYAAATTRVSEQQPNGEVVQLLNETLVVLCAFYGPLCQRHAARLRDALRVDQNHQQLKQSTGLLVIDTGPLRFVPELLNQTQWVPRCDIEITLRREVRRTYPVHTLLSAGGEIRTKTRTIPWSAEP